MSERQEKLRLAVPVGSRDHIQGPATAPVTLVEYGDYECPSCGAAYPIVKEVYCSDRIWTKRPEIE